MIQGLNQQKPSAKQQNLDCQLVTYSLLQQRIVTHHNIIIDTKKVQSLGPCLKHLTTMATSWLYFGSNEN